MLTVINDINSITSARRFTNPGKLFPLCMVSRQVFFRGLAFRHTYFCLSTASHGKNGRIEIKAAERCLHRLRRLSERRTGFLLRSVKIEFLGCSVHDEMSHLHCLVRIPV